MVHIVLDPEGSHCQVGVINHFLFLPLAARKSILWILTDLRASLIMWLFLKAILYCTFTRSTAGRRFLGSGVDNSGGMWVMTLALIRLGFLGLGGPARARIML